MDSGRLPGLLGLCDQDIGHLRHAGLAHLPPSTPQPKEPIDYVALRETYARMLGEGPFSSQTELARQLGVSSVWVSRVLKGIKRKAGRPSNGSSCPNRELRSYFTEYPFPSRQAE